MQFSCINMSLKILRPCAYDAKMIGRLSPTVYCWGNDLIFRGKWFCTKGEVRVRFAPSPTGNLHLGGLRTAMYNYFYARKNCGKFILRIEDTDQKRVKPASLENLQQMLSWAGLTPDESPAVGGDYGPYVQSQRLEKYREKAQELLESGHAYRCFCSETRLSIVKKEAMKNHLNFGYDNKCRHLLPSEISEFMEKKQPFTIRFKINDGPVTFNDIVYGSQTHDISQSEGDFVIMKSDGYPTYHFACVVDDHHMAISHVLRGAEWLPSTVKHIMLHLAFNWKPPTFAHLPLLVNRDRTKLSKRQEALGVQYLKDKGYEPLAVLNLLAGVGSGFNLAQCCDLFELDDLCNRFNLSEVGRNSCFLDLTKLEAYNHKYLVKRMSNKRASDALLQKFRMLLTEKLGQRYETEAQNVSDEYIKRILECYQDRISNLSELVEPDMQYLWTSPDIRDVRLNLQEFNVDLTDVGEVIEKTIELLLLTPECDYTRETLKYIFKEFVPVDKLTHVTLMRVLRILLTGKKDGPSVGEIISMLGKDRCIKKLKTVAYGLDNSKLPVMKQSS